MKQKIFIILLLWIPLHSFSQKSDFIDKITKCHNKKEFKNTIYRTMNDYKCFLGLKFPDFLMEDIYGNSISGKNISGKVVVINFWFTACPPCLEELPTLNKISKKFKQKACVFLAPTIDNKQMILDYLKTYKFDFKIIPNSENWIVNELGIISGYPTTIVLDKKGIIRGYFSFGESPQELKINGKVNLYYSLERLISVLLEE